VKNNQKSLLSGCQKICNNYNATSKYNAGYDVGHGRVEKRITYVFSGKDYIKNHIPAQWQKYVKSIICIHRERKIYSPKGQKPEISIEDSYYVCTHNIDAKKAGDAVKKHWEIENRKIM
jgi:hypothetical protein